MMQYCLLNMHQCGFRSLLKLENCHLDPKATGHGKFFPAQTFLRPRRKKSLIRITNRKIIQLCSQCNRMSVYNNRSSEIPENKTWPQRRNIHS